MRWLLNGVVAAVALAATLLTGCMTFETTLPGTLDLRGALAQPQDAPLEPKRPAFADGNDSWNEGAVLLSESTEKPVAGEYVVPKEPVAGQYVTPAAPSGAAIYRRVMRQWFILGLIPLMANPDNFTADLRTELAKPGAKATNIRITTGQDLLDWIRFIPVPIWVLLAYVPTRRTEVIAYLETGNAAVVPAATPPPVETPPAAPATPATPAAPDKPVTK